MLNVIVKEIVCFVQSIFLLGSLPENKLIS